MRSDTRPFLTSWIVANAWAEAFGLGTTFVVGGWLGPKMAAQTGAVAVLLAAALAIALGTVLEGVVVGIAQERVLARELPSMRRGSWTRATAVGAGVAWLIGMVPSTVINLVETGGPSAPPELPALAQYALAVLLGAVTGPILGLAQWVTLRRSVDGAIDWLVANAVAWAVGMPLIFFGMDYVPWDGPALVRVIAIYGVCAATGATVGALHGPVLESLVRHPRQFGKAPRSDRPFRRSTQVRHI